MENDQVKASIWDIKEQMDLDDEEEGILAAIDLRKYKIFKQIINWNQVNDLLDETTNETENEGSDEQSENDDVEAEDKEAEDSDTIIE